jgi:hypothetical protein
MSCFYLGKLRMDRRLGTSTNNQLLSDLAQSRMPLVEADDMPRR